MRAFKKGVRIVEIETGKGDDRMRSRRSIERLAMLFLETGKI